MNYGTAKLSDCGTYRYRLTRVLFDGEGSANFIMLNPSTADASVDDPTIRRCTRYVRDWGYAELVVTNLYALRATDPRMLLRYGEPVGPENDAELLRAATVANLVVCAWGTFGGKRAQAVVGLLRGIPLSVLRLTRGGFPAHPLYLPANLRPVAWAPVLNFAP